MSSNTKTILWGAGLSLAILVGLAYWTTRTAPEAASGGGTALAAAETEYDFGTVSMAQGKVTHDFRIQNGGSAPLTIRRVYTSCMCTQANLLTASGNLGPFGMLGMGFEPSVSETLAPREAATIQAVFDPAAHGPAGVGPVDRTITIETNSGDPLVLGFHAVVAP